MTESQEARGENDALSVSDALNLAKMSLEAVAVTIVGEVSEVSVKAGYKAAYFTIKDTHASLPCMMWNNRYRTAGFDLAVGQLVQIVGRFSVYAAKGRMNFDVFSLALTGEGDLRLKVANLAKKLRAEGLTDEARKRPLPAYPQRIGVVTSPRGAVVHDMLRTLRRRFPTAEMLIAGVPVEGPQAAAGLIEGLRCVVEAGAEVVLLGRGGGSFEDLMPFNDEALARAVAACPVPVVTGVGHEVDTTLADMVSDLRASTPTAAAEAVSPAREALEATLLNYGAALERTMTQRIERTWNYLGRIADKPWFRDPLLLFAAEAQALDAASDRLGRALPERLERMGLLWQRDRERLEQLGPRLLERCKFAVGQGAVRLEDLSPVSTLARGYAIARDSRGDIVKSVDQVAEGQVLTVTVADGRVDCTVNETLKGAPMGVDAKGEYL